MGHDLPEELCDLFVVTVGANCARASASTGARANTTSGL
jgi:hypothetical protein